MKKIDKALIVRFFQRETTEQENQALAEWIMESPEHKDIFDKEYDLFVVSQVMLSANAVKNMRSGGGRVRSIRILKYAVSVAAALFIGLAVNHVFISKPALDKLENTVLVSEAQPGQRTTVYLSDGTRVDLNSGSSLVYPAIFHGDKRGVKLYGEAIFEVVKDTGKPFIVETFAYDVRVHGTKFDVIAEESKNDFSTTLLEGKVEILDKNAQTVTVLDPGMTVRIDGSKLVRSTIDNKDEFLWVNGVVSLTGLSFNQILRKLERCYGVSISSSLEEEPAIRYAYLKVRISDGIEHALQILQRRCSFNYSHDEENNTYYIY